MEYSEIEGIVTYLRANPIIAVGLVVLGVMVLGSIIRKLIKAAILLGAILVIGVYWTHLEAEDDWRARAEELGRRASALGQEALERGRELIKDELREQLTEQDGK